MKIRKATPTDLDILLRLYDSARRFMAAHGNPTQWGTAYPPRTLLESDIAEGRSYVCEEQQKVIATFYYRFGEEDSYRRICNGQWLDESPYGVVHRIGRHHPGRRFLLSRLGTLAVQKPEDRYAPGQPGDAAFIRETPVYPVRDHLSRRRQ